MSDNQLTNANIPPIKNGLNLVKKSLPKWRVVEKNNIISCYRDFTCNGLPYLVRLSLDGMCVFMREEELLSSKDFPLSSDQYRVVPIGQMDIGGFESFTDYAFETLFTSSEENFIELRNALLFLGRFYISKLQLDKQQTK